MQRLSFDFVGVNFVKFKYSAGIEEYPFNWKRFNKSGRYPISENAWNDQVTRQKYYYKLG